MQEILEELDPLEDLHTLVEESILEEPHETDSRVKWR